MGTIAIFKKIKLEHAVSEANIKNLEVNML